MSKYNNVNPGQYKVKGRERQGEDIVHELEKARASRLKSLKARNKKSSASRPAGRATSDQKP
jgi:hypothetical protein